MLLSSSGWASASAPAELTVVLDLYAIEATSGSTPVVSALVSSTVTGGSGSYSYLWVWDSNDDAIVADTDTAANTTFRRNMPSGITYSATGHLVVTDPVYGISGNSPSFSVTLTRT